MKSLLSKTCLTIVLALGSLGAGAHGGAKHQKTASAAPVMEQKAWGIAGKAETVNRTITLRMNDDMRYRPDTLQVKQGETVRIVIHNDGAMMHEAVIGTRKDLDEHAAWMKKFPEMEHDEPWMAHVAPGEKGEIVWTFNRTGEFDFGCLIPKHYEAGMVGKIFVTP